MPFSTLKFPWKLSHPYRALIWLVAIALLYALYINGIENNPRGFYLDESFIAYNAYTIYKTGRGEFGDFFPLYFPTFRLPPPYDFLGYADSIYIYLLSALYFVFPPSILLSRLLSATVGFLAALLLGILATRISRQRNIGIIVFLMALLTPWLFELSRLVFGVALYPLVLVLFLLALHRAHFKERWTLLDIVLLALTLALVTYTYTIGRLLGPALALGLLFFATDLKRLRNVVKTWIAYSLTLLPLLMFIRSHPGAISQRFSWLTYITPEKTFWEIAVEFIKNYIQSISFQSLLFTGDTNLRHHIPGMGLIFAATFILAVMSIFIVLVRYRKNPWWRFILFGLIIAPVPSALTRDPIHMLRLIAFPIFFLALTVPALEWLLEDVKSKLIQNKFLRFVLRTSIFRLRLIMLAPAWLRNNFTRQWIRRSVLIILLIMTLLQAIVFQKYFREIGLNRGPWFDEAYPRVLAVALATKTRPIYLVDGYWGQAYIHAYWYATIQGIPLSNFVHVPDGASPPTGSLVISTETEDKCAKCQIIFKDDKFLLYRLR